MDIWYIKTILYIYIYIIYLCQLYLRTVNVDVFASAEFCKSKYFMFVLFSERYNSGPLVI